MAKISNSEQLAGAKASYGLYPEKYALVHTVFLLTLFIFATGGYTPIFDGSDNLHADTFQGANADTVVLKT